LRKGEGRVTTWKMNDESDPMIVRISFSLAFAISTSILFSFVPSSNAVHEVSVLVYVSVCVARLCVRVLEQVRRRLKSRQPGGRRCSKGFRLVPPTRTASVAAVHPRAGAGQIKRARADNTGHRAYRETTRAREAERCCRTGKEVAPSVRASKTVSWQGNSLEDDTPATSSSWSGWKVGRMLGKKERGVPGAVF